MAANNYFDGTKFRHAIPSNAGNSAVSHRPKSRNFQIDATAAVNSQQERRIQLQGNSPYTTRRSANNPARSWARGRPQRGGAAEETPAPAGWHPPQTVATAPCKSRLVYPPPFIDCLGNRTAPTFFPHAQRRPQPCRAYRYHMRANNLGSRPPARV